MIDKTNTNAPIEAWKCNFPPSYDKQTKQPADQETDRRGHREVTLPTDP